MGVRLYSRRVGGAFSYRLCLDYRCCFAIRRLKLQFDAFNCRRLLLQPMPWLSPLINSSLRMDLSDRDFDLRIAVAPVAVALMLQSRLLTRCDGDTACYNAFASVLAGSNSLARVVEWSPLVDGLVRGGSIRRVDQIAALLSRRSNRCLDSICRIAIYDPRSPRRSTICCYCRVLVAGSNTIASVRPLPWI